MNNRLKIILFILFLIGNTLALNAQNRSLVKSGFVTQKAIRGNLVSIRAIEYRGLLQWQKSTNGIDWIDMVGQTENILYINIEQDSYFRVSVKDNTCDWYFSDMVYIIAIEKPTVVTYPVTDIAINEGLLSGEIINSGNDTVTLAGICYGTTVDPDTTGTYFSYTGNESRFEYQATGLSANTNYYVRAFAVNDAGITYGSQTIFTTLIGFPDVATDTLLFITDSSARMRGHFTLINGGERIASGFCYGTSPDPDLNGSFIEADSDSTVFEALLTNLQPNVRYYVRAFVTNEAGTAFGDNYEIRTLHRIPFVETLLVSNITPISAMVTGEVLDTGGGIVSKRGFCWSTSPLPDTTHSKVLAGTGPGEYTALISILANNTPYFVRAFALNEAGIVYGNQLEFTTLPALPRLTTRTATAITTQTAVSGGEILYNGGAAILTKGVCWSTDTLPDTGDNKAFSNLNSDNYTANLTGLSPNTKYHIRAFATNIQGTGYGENKTFTTSVALPTVTTGTYSNLSFKQATLSGTVTTTGNGTISARGFCYSVSANPTMSDSIAYGGTGSGGYTAILTGLKSATTYYVKSFCTNEAGTVYGNQVTFTTPVAKPVAATTLVHNVNSVTASVDGQIVSTGGGSITLKGICWGNQPNPDITGNHTNNGGGAAPFTGLLTDLQANELYYARAFATSAGGTSYGNILTFKTPDNGTYSDIPVLGTEVRSSFRGWTGIFPPKGTAGAMGYSGITYDWERNQIMIIGNNALYIWVIEAPGYGKWSDNNPAGGYIKAIELEGFFDTEAITYLGNSWIMIAEEGLRQVYFCQINDNTVKITKGSASVITDPTVLFTTAEASGSTTQLEGIAFDFHNQKVYALCEVGVLDYPRLFMWDWDPVTRRIKAGTRQEITSRFQSLSTDFPAASDLFYSPLLKRLYIVDGSTNKMGEYDCSNPNSVSFGRKLALMQEPLTNGTTGADLGDLEGFAISADGLYSYCVFEDKSFGYGIAPMVRNLPDNNLPVNLYPFNGTPGTWDSDDFPDLNDPTVYLSRFKKTTELVDTTLLETRWNSIPGPANSSLTNLSDLAFDEVNDRLWLVTRAHPTNNQVSFLNFIDMNGSYVGRHTLNQAYRVNPDGSQLAGVNRSLIGGLYLRPNTNLNVSWLSSLDGSVLSVNADEVNGWKTYGNQVTDPRVTLIGNGQNYGTSTANTYEALAVDPVHRNCLWTTKQTSFSLEEYRGDTLHRIINYGSFNVPGAGKTVNQLVTHITGLYYDYISDHLFIGGYHSTTNIAYLIEMKMLDKTIMGYLRLNLAQGLEGFAFNETLTRLAVLHKNGTQPLLIFKK